MQVVRFGKEMRRRKDGLICSEARRAVFRRRSQVDGGGGASQHSAAATSAQLEPRGAINDLTAIERYFG